MKNVKNVLYSAAGEKGPSWSPCKKHPGRLEDNPWDSELGDTKDLRPAPSWWYCSLQGYWQFMKGFDLLQKWLAANVLLAPWLPVLGWMFKGRVPAAHHATGARWSKWITQTTQWAQTENASSLRILEFITNCPKYFRQIFQTVRGGGRKGDVCWGRLHHVIKPCNLPTLHQSSCPERELGWIEHTFKVKTFSHRLNYLKMHFGGRATDSGNNTCACMYIYSHI